jgi:hypothetical protein
MTIAFTTKRVHASLAAAAVLVVTLAVGGCGDDEASAAGLPADFRDKVNAVCAVEIANHDDHPFPLSDFDPRHPTADQLATVAAYFERYGHSQQMVQQLKDLGEPARSAESWRSFLTLLDEDADRAADQLAAAKQRNLAAWDHTLDVADDLHQRIGDAGQELGFDPSSDCGQFYG